MFRHVWLFVTPWPVACQAPQSMGFSRQEYQSGLPFPSPGDLPDPRIEPTSLASPALAGGFSTTSATWEPHLTIQHRKYRCHQPWWDGKKEAIPEDGNKSVRRRQKNTKQRMRGGGSWDVNETRKVKLFDLNEHNWDIKKKLQMLAYGDRVLEN